jgi:DNA polymerase I-like protein with 3'-5' exonuclease and polymerase domains
MQMSLFPTQSDWKPKGLFVPWKGAKRVGYDIEARDPTLKKLGSGAGRRKDSYITGVSYAIEDGPSEYLPIRHEGGDNLPVEGVLRYLREQAATFDGELVGANLPYDLDFSMGDDIHFRSVKRFRDVQIADPLIYELHDSYSLDNISKRWGFDGKDEKTLREAAKEYGVDPKAELWKLPARFVGAYGEGDVTLPLRVLRRQEREIEAQELWNVYNLESDLLPILTEMRHRGVRIHQDRLARIESWALSEETEALAQVRNATGVSIAVGEVMQTEIVERVFTSLGVRVRRTKTGKPNIDQAAMDAVDHPAMRALEHARKVNKLRTTFAASVRHHMTPDGRIHCSYNQLRRQKDEDYNGNDADLAGGRYGRLSCEHPNLQQQLSREDFAPAWRAIYLPEEGDIWAAEDLSQQEPRMAIHYACLSRYQIGDFAWEKALEARNKYRNDPNTDNHQMMADMAGIKRKAAKELFLGLSYGMGGAKMCRKLGLPTRMVVRGARGILFDVDSLEGRDLLKTGARRFEAAGAEGQALLDEFNARVPFVRKLAMACEQKAKVAGFLRTLSGRRCRFPKDASGNYDWTYKALNRLIQGSSADQVKMGMLALHKAGIRMLIQVHDEIAVSVRNEIEARRAAQIMVNCCPLELPSKVDVEMGESWGGSMGWKEAA